jgi:hypothetical protein
MKTPDKEASKQDTRSSEGVDKSNFQAAADDKDVLQKQEETEPFNQNDNNDVEDSKPPAINIEAVKKVKEVKILIKMIMIKMKKMRKVRKMRKMQKVRKVRKMTKIENAHRRFLDPKYL